MKILTNTLATDITDDDEQEEEMTDIYKKYCMNKYQICKMKELFVYKLNLNIFETTHKH